MSPQGPLPPVFFEYYISANATLVRATGTWLKDHEIPFVCFIKRKLKEIETIITHLPAHKSTLKYGSASDL